MAKKIFSTLTVAFPVASVWFGAVVGLLWFQELLLLYILHLMEHGE